MSNNNNKVVIEISSESIASVSTTVKGIIAAVFYGVCSVSTAFVNKTLMTTLEFDYPIFIMVIQMIFTILILELLSFTGIIDLPVYSLSRARKFLWPAIFYGINAVLALTALAHMNIAMYGVLKRCVPLTTMILAVVILKKGKSDGLTLFSVLLLTLGCVVAGYGDMTFELNGYLCGALSNITQATYLLLVQKYSEKEQSTVETLQLNSFNTLPLLAVACVVNGEMGTFWDYKHFSSPMFYVMLFLAVSTGCLLNYSLFLCTGMTSALTTSVVGGLKALAQTLLGLVTFGGVSHNLPTYTGISMNLVGGILYIFAKYGDMRRKKQVDLKKVMSLSSAEEFREYSQGQSNGHRHKIGNGMCLEESFSHKNISNSSS